MTERRRHRDMGQSLDQIPRRILEQLHEINDPDLLRQVLFQQYYNPDRRLGDKRPNYYHHSRTGERVIVTAHKSPVDMPIESGHKNLKSTILIASGNFSRRPVMLASDKGHHSMYKIWDPKRDIPDRILRLESRTAIRAQLEKRIKQLNIKGPQSTISDEVNAGTSAVIPTGTSAAPVANDAVASQPTAPVNDRPDTPDREAEEPLGNVPADPESDRMIIDSTDTTTIDELALLQIKQELTSSTIDLTGDEEPVLRKVKQENGDGIAFTSHSGLLPPQIKRDLDCDDYRKKRTMIFFKNAENVTERKSPLAEVTNARSLHLRFVAAFRLKTSEDVMMVASVNGRKSMRLVSNDASDFETLVLAIKNDRCWSRENKAETMCKVEMRMELEDSEGY